MANNKKIYSIVINGIKESSDAIDILLEKLTNLEERLNKVNSIQPTTNTNTSEPTSESSTNSEAVSIEAELATQQKNRTSVLGQLTKALEANKTATTSIITEDTKASKSTKELSKELADLKTKINSIKGGIDIDSKDIAKSVKDIDKFNKELTDVEQSLPNVNNETANFSKEILEAAVGLKSFNANAEDVDAQLNSLSDAMKELAVNGQKSSEAYKTLESEFVNLRKTSKEVDEELESMSDRSRGLTQVVQSFQALISIMQVGSGVAALFGANQEEIERSMQKMVALMSIAQGVQEIYTQALNKSSIIGKTWALAMVGAEKIMSLFTKSTAVNAAMQRTNAAATTTSAAATTVLATSTTAAATAMKVLKIAIASTGIGLLVVAFGSLVGWLMSFESATDKIGKSAATLQDALKGINSDTEDLVKNSDMLVRVGQMRPFDKLIKDAGYYEKALLNTIQDINLFTVALDKAFNGKKISSKNIHVALNNVSNALVNQKLGVEDSDKGLKKYTQDLAIYIKKEFQRIDTVKKAWGQNEEYAKSTDRLMGLIRLINQEGIDFNKILGIEGFNEMIDSYKSGYNKLSEANIKIEEKLLQGIKESEKNKIEAKEEGLNKQLELIEYNKKEELKQYDLGSNQLKGLTVAEQEDLGIIRQSIEAKYNRQRLDASKAHAKDKINVDKLIAANEIAAMNDGLEKQLASIELQRSEELKSAKESGVKIGEQTIAINKKYDKQVLDEKKAYYEEREKLLKDFEASYIESSSRTAQLEADIAMTSVSNRGDKEQTALTFNTDSTLQESVDEQKKYYEELIKLKSSTADTLSKMKIEQVDYVKTDDINAEKKRQEDRINVIKDSVTKGLITQTEADKEIEREGQLHATALKYIETKSKQDIEAIVKESNDIKKDSYVDYFSSVTSAYTKYSNDIKELETKSESKNSFGLINYNKTKSNLNKVKSEYDNILKGIKSEYDKLQTSFDNKEITFNDFKQAKEELKGLEKDVNESSDNTSKSLEDLLGDTIGSINEYFQVVGQAAMQLMSAVNDFQMAALDAQAELLSQEADELDDALTKQEDVVQSHKDKINSIEDELANSRGDRRQHLIDQLNAEKSAQVSALEEEQKIQKKKEQNEKKQEQLAKKRRQQEKKNALTQAIISGALAIANGLATQPFMPVGIAMGALAATLTAVQVALISKQKFAQGGVLEGKSHAQGGIKTPLGELEGGEFVTKVKSTKKNIGLLTFINNSEKRINKNDMDRYFEGKEKVTINKNIKQKYAQGGTLPILGDMNIEEQLQNTIVNQDNRPIYVSVSEIENVQESIRQVRVLSGDI